MHYWKLSHAGSVLCNHRMLPQALLVHWPLLAGDEPIKVQTFPAIACSSTNTAPAALLKEMLVSPQVWPSAQRSAHHQHHHKVRCTSVYPAKSRSHAVAGPRVQQLGAALAGLRAGCWIGSLRMEGLRRPPGQLVVPSQSCLI